MKLSGVRLFAFDFDGTLMQSNEIKRSVFYEVCEQISDAHDCLDELFRSRPELDRYGIFDALAEQVNDIDPDALVRNYTARCEERILSCPEVLGTTVFLDKLAEIGRHTVVNSATPEVDLRPIVSRLSIGSKIQVVYGEPASKAQNLKKAMALYNVGPDQTVMIGDRESDRASAQETGCLFIGVRSEISDFNQKPKWLVDDLTTLDRELE